MRIATDDADGRRQRRHQVVLEGAGVRRGSWIARAPDPLHAPDLLLAEFANTIWKKVRGGEVSDSRPYTAEVSALGEIIALHPMHNLVVRSASIAKEIDHPIYDCLYLACAEATDSTLVTADRRFANKVGDAFGRVDVRYIREERFAHEFGFVSGNC